MKTGKLDSYLTSETCGKKYNYNREINVTHQRFDASKGDSVKEIVINRVTEIQNNT